VLLHGLDQVLKVGFLRGVGVVVGEVAVHFAEERDDLAAELFVERDGDHAAHAVGRVDHDLELALQLDPLRMPATYLGGGPAG
jgi:hypothetical protein